MTLHYSPPLTTGQTVINLPFQYVVGINELFVFINGSLGNAGVDYIETGAHGDPSTAFEVTFDLHETDIVLVKKIGGNATALSLGDLLDVETSGASDKAALTWNNVDFIWEPVAPYQPETLPDLLDVTLTNLQDNQVLTYDSTEGKWFNQDIVDGLQGPQGDIGPQGLQGVPGADGVDGVQGIQGPAGPQGDQGIQGEIGPQGAQGPQGLIGDQGPKGDIGSQGLQGVPGNDGVDGVQGIQGPAGIQGDQGIQGEIGPQGAQGPQGLIGDQGPKGDIGEPGLQGIPGNDGVDGIQGIQGPAGADGQDGSQGPKGDMGDQGLQGLPGQDGVDGNEGPQGIPGNDGQDGLQGPKGDMGSTGLQGQPGIDGVDGNEGPQGPPGPQGEPGVCGPKGNKGHAGHQGPKGDRGITGPSGPPGPPGSGSGGADAGQITVSGLNDGRLGISFVASARQTGLTDLKVSVRDPDDNLVATGVPLIEYYNTGAYYAEVDVGVTNLGPHLVSATSSSVPTNNGIKIYNVSVTNVQRGGHVVQEATREFGYTFAFKHVAEPNLSDVQITIYDVYDIPVKTDEIMIEIGNTGVYKYNFNPASAGTYTGIMSSITVDSKTVAEVIFVTKLSSSSTVIANNIGVTGKKN